MPAAMTADPRRERPVVRTVPVTGGQPVGRAVPAGRQQPVGRAVPAGRQQSVGVTRGSVQISGLESQKALGALDSRDSLRASAALRPVVLASSGFVERPRPFSPPGHGLFHRQKPSLGRSLSEHRLTRPHNAYYTRVSELRTDETRSWHPRRSRSQHPYCRGLLAPLLLTPLSGRYRPTNVQSPIQS
jgi:hypothetical protein